MSGTCVDGREPCLFGLVSLCEQHAKKALEGKRQHTRIVCACQTEGKRREGHEQDGQPAGPERWSAPGNTSQEVSVGLNDVVEEHHDEGQAHAKDQIHDDGPSTLSLCGYGEALLGIHDTGEGTDNAEGSSRQCYSSGNHELDFDVAKTLAVVFAFEVIRRPYEEIDEAEQVVKYDPGHQAACRHISISNVPYERR